MTALRLVNRNSNGSLVPVAGKYGYITLSDPVVNKGNIRLQFMAPLSVENRVKEGDGSSKQIHLGDYASAGNTDSEGSAFQVWFAKMINPATSP